jgi:hypothetical protein
MIVVVWKFNDCDSCTTTGRYYSVLPGSSMGAAIGEFEGSTCSDLEYK